MARHMKRRAKKTGLPPGSLTHVGEAVVGAAKITVTRYSEDKFEVFEAKGAKECRPHPEGGSVTWVNVAGVHDPEIIHAIGTAFKLHPLTMEDIMNTDHLTKIDFIENYIFLVLKNIVCNHGSKDSSVSQQVSLVLGPGWAISFQETDEDLYGPLRNLLKADRATFAKYGAGYLLYRLIDIVVDDYYCSLEKIDEEIYMLEEDTTSRYHEGHMQKIQGLRRQVVVVRRAAWPLREVISMLQKRESSLIAESNSIYFADIYDHVVQVIDTTETFREVLSNVFDIYLTYVSNGINEVMKVLTIIATIMMPLTFIAGVYGMNFKNMPEISWRYGYPAALIAMAAVAISMLLFFRKKKWF